MSAVPGERPHLLRRLRQSVCSHPNTEEEWTETDRVPGLLLDTVTRLRTYWRCNTCGKEVRRSRRTADDFGSTEDRDG